MPDPQHRLTDDRAAAPSLASEEKSNDSGSSDRRWCLGDEGIVAIVLKEHGANFARRLCRKYELLVSVDEAEEIASVAIEHAWEHRTDFLPAKGTLAGWLWRIVDHFAASETRTPWCQERMHERGVDPEKLSLAVARRAETVDQPALTDRDADEPRLVIRALQVLSKVERAILWRDACAPDGTLSSSVLAAELGIAASTVRRHRQRGKAKLQVELIRLGYAKRSRGGRGGDG